MIQETIQKTKNGGPYTKPEQEERRNKVYELYFEKGYSARKIAKELDVHRNAIDSSIPSGVPVHWPMPSPSSQIAIPGTTRRV